MSEPPSSGSWIEIDAACLEANLTALRDLVTPAELCLVIKGNAYGHGYQPIVPLTEASGVRRFAVFSTREAIGFLAASDGDSRLMLMGRTDPENLPWAIQNDLEPWVNTLDDWACLAAMANEMQRPVRVHIEVETGMNRTGMVPDDAFEAAHQAQEHPFVHLEGVCTHLAGRESDENDERIAAQTARYEAFLDRLRAAGIDPGRRHVASSAAALLDPHHRLDLCRVGIAAYGLWPSRQVYSKMRRRSDLVLHNVLSWKSRVIALKNVPDGEYVGYGHAYEAEGPTRIAVVAVGYGDGFARALSNQGYVLVRGRRASIVGNVNMNMLQVHVTHIPDVRVGDEVVLIGRQGEREISVASFADFNAFVNYELMARLSHEVPRVIMRSEPPAPPLR